MRIVSLNAWGGAVWEQLSAWVEQAAFDVLCLQEVTRRIAPSPDWLIYRDPYRRLDQRANLFGAHLHGLRDPNGRVIRPTAIRRLHRCVVSSESFGTGMRPWLSPEILTYCRTARPSTCWQQKG